MNRLVSLHLAAIVSIVTALPVIAARWVVVSQPGSSDTVSVDATSIKVQGRQRLYWWEIKLSQPTVYNYVIINGYRMYSVVDCIDGTYPVQKFQGITQHNTVGFTIKQGTNSAVRLAPSSSNVEIAMKVVCSL